MTRSYLRGVLLGALFVVVAATIAASPLAEEFAPAELTSAPKTKAAKENLSSTVASLSSGALPVETTTVAFENGFLMYSTYTGVVVARRSTPLSFQLGGKVTEVLVDDGEAVKSGQVVARLDTRRLLAQQREIQAKRASAAAVLAELEAGPRTEQIEAAKAETRGFGAQVELMMRKHSRRAKLFEKDSLAQEEFETSKFELAATKAKYEAAQKRLDELLSGVRPEKIEAQKAVLEQLEAAHDLVKTELTDSTLRAPFDGAVSARMVDEGAVISAGQPLLQLVENQKLEARIGLPPSLAASLNIKAPKEVAIGGKKLPAKVSAILPEVDRATRTQTVVLSIDPSSASNTALGQTARIEIEERVSQAGFWLSTDALTRSARGLWSCYVVIHQNGEARVERRDVELLHTGSDRVFVRGAVSEGEQIITSGAHRLTDGQHVSLSPKAL